MHIRKGLGGYSIRENYFFW